RGRGAVRRAEVRDRPFPEHGAAVPAGQGPEVAGRAGRAGGRGRDHRGRREAHAALRRHAHRRPGAAQPGGDDHVRPGRAGGHRDVDTPVSVVGASRIGGELISMGAWTNVLYLFAVLNLFFGIFNLLPLLPMDGGHIAIAWFEKARSWIAARRGRPDPGRVDYVKLMPITLAVISVLGVFVLLTVTADIIHPISIPR